MSSSDEEPQTKRLRKDSNLYLIGCIDHQILGAKLPSNRQVLSVYFYNTRVAKLNKSESATLVAEEVSIFYSKARIPVAKSYNNSLKVQRLVDEYKDLQKNSSRTNEKQLQKEKMFVDKLDDLFDMSHADAFDIIKDADVREFLNLQRQKGRVGCLLGVEGKKEAAEQRRQLRLDQEKARQAKASSESQQNGMN